MLTNKERIYSHLKTSWQQSIQIVLHSLLTQQHGNVQMVNDVNDRWKMGLTVIYVSHNYLIIALLKWGNAIMSKHCVCCSSS